MDSDSSEDDIRANIRPLLNIAKSGAIMRETLGSLMKSRNSLRNEQGEKGRATVLGVPICTLRGDEIKINDNV